MADDDIEILELPYAKWGVLEEAFAACNSPLPLPSAAILIALKEDKILGFVVLQTKLHAEPGFVFPEAQNQKVLEKIYSAIDNILPVGVDYYITTDSEAMIRRAIGAGFTKLGTALGKVITE